MKKLFLLLMALVLLPICLLSQTVPTPTLVSPPNDSTMLNSASSIAFKWKKVTGSNLIYTIEVANSTVFDTVVYTRELNTGTDTQYDTVSSKFTTGTIYYWRVKATDTAAGAYGQWSAVWKFTTRLEYPNLVSPLTDASLDSNSVYFNWNKNTDINAKSFNLWYTTDTNSTTGLVKKENIIDTFLFVTPITAGAIYYWKVQSKNTTGVSNFSGYRKFTISSPCTLIENANVKIEFLHSEGSILNITYKKGSGKELINTLLNTSGKKGLEKITNETGSVLQSWTPSTEILSEADQATFVYSNSAYGSKKFVISWDSSGVDVKTYLYIATTKGPFTLGGFWKPGGDNSSIWDSMMIVNNKGIRTYSYIQYPGSTSSTLYSGKAASIGIWDSRYNEMFGYKYPYDTSQIIVTNGVSLDGPIFTLPKNAKTTTDTVSYTFAIKNKSNFLTWIGAAPYTITKPAKDTTLSSSSDSISVTVKWDHKDSSAIKIKYSSDNGINWGTVKSNSVDSNSYISKLPVNNTSFYRIKIEKESDSTSFGISEKFAVYSTTTVQFHLGKNVISSPGARITIPFTIKTSSKGISSFDARIQFNKNILAYLMDNSKSVFDITKWVIALTDSSKNGWIQLSGYAKSNADKLAAGTATTVNFSFTINSATRVGTKEDVIFNTTYLAAADTIAQSQKIIGFNGNYSVYSKITGGLKYYSRSFGLQNSIIQFIFTSPTVDTSLVQLSDTIGYYSLTSIKPSNLVTITVNGKSIKLDTSAVVTAADAFLTFQGRDGGTQALTGYQKIAADVNNDKVINSSDALAILKRSTSSISKFDVDPLSPWIFIDSAYSANTGENWKTPIKYISWGPVDSVKSNKNFIGIVYGDVNGSLSADTIAPVLKVGPAFINEEPLDPQVVYTHIMLNKLASHRAGDTITVPINISPKGNKLISFNIKLEFEAAKLKYLNEYSFGPSVPNGLGWVMDVNPAELGAVYFGSANFAQTVNPIAADGVLLNLKFKVSNNLMLNDSIQLKLNRLNAGSLIGGSVPLTYSNGMIKISGTSDVEEDLLPKEYNISQNYPNPFNPSTKIKFALPFESKVGITIFNSLGQIVKQLVNEVKKAGYHETEFDAKNFPSGVYFYNIDATSIENDKTFSTTKKMLLIK